MNKYFHIYGAIDCPFCVDAVMLLTSLGYEYALTLMDQAPTHSALVKSAYGHPTIPIIVYCSGLEQEEFIGGSEDLVKFLQKTFEKKEEKGLTDIDE